MITLKDNTPNSLSIEVAKVLRDYSHKSLNALLKENSSLSIFSKELNNEDFYKSTMWSICDNTIQTNNLMGFIGLPDCPVRITSRFTQNAEKDYFLHYMLQKVFLGQVINLDIGTTSNESLWEYYYYLFPYQLNRALVQGLYKEYIHKKYNNINVRGAIDVKRHIQKNMPFLGKIAYNTHEHSYNNRITHLIRHTIEQIQKLPIGNSLLNANLEVRENVDQIKHVTTDFHHSNRQAIISDSRERISNPYWNEYEKLRVLCLKILNRDKLSFDSDNDKVHGILFDGAWLWEEYLATVLGNMFIHPDNRRKSTSIKLTKEGFYRYPDFYSKDKKIVLDAKYKHPAEDRREDTHQIITYMYALKSEKGMLVYPSQKGSNPKIYSLNGYGNSLIHNTFQIAIEKETFREFCAEMRVNENIFLYSLNN